MILEIHDKTMCASFRWTNAPQGFCRFAETCLDHGVYDGLLGCIELGIETQLIADQL